MIKTVHDIWNRIVDYPNLQRANIELLDQVTNFQARFHSCSSALSKLKKKLEKPSVHDAEYWDNKWEKSRIRYRAPKAKEVTKYVKYREIKEVSDIARNVINASPLNADDVDAVPIAVLKWLEKQFKARRFKYKLDKGEDWATSEVLLERKYGDCDDWGILEYYLIREIFTQLNIWEHVKHRLKCVAGNVNRYGSIPSTAGGHFYLNWLHSDGQWYTVESTYYRSNAINNYGKMPQKYNSAYGVIWFSFNEDYSWTQNSLTISRGGFKK